jgi:hypothetical protein
LSWFAEDMRFYKKFDHIFIVELVR